MKYFISSAIPRPLGCFCILISCPAETISSRIRESKDNLLHGDTKLLNQEFLQSIFKEKEKAWVVKLKPLFGIFVTAGAKLLSKILFWSIVSSTWKTN